LYVEGGKLICTMPAGCGVGTDVAVRDLFFNTPARRKFLKSLATEENHIQETVLSLSLPYPSVSFDLFFDGKPFIQSPAHDSLQPRLRAFFGAPMQSAFLPVQYVQSGLCVKGWIARHGFFRNSRRDQRLYVNGRPVDAVAGYHGVRDGYGSMIPKGKYPPVVLFLEMDPATVDVNVHPAKREVRFRQERTVSQVIAEAIRAALKSSAAPSAHLPEGVSLSAILGGFEVNYPVSTETPSLGIPEEADAENVMPFSLEALASDANERSGPDPDTPVSSAEYEERIPSIPGRSSGAESAGSRADREPDRGPSTSPIPPMRVLGTVGATYIVADTDSGMLLIDQHAAHERVLFEKLLNGARRGVASQKLLLPITIELNRIEAAYLERERELFRTFGFDIEPFGQNTIMVHETPAALPQQDIAGLLSRIIHELMETGDVGKDADLARISMAACKHAVRADRQLREPEIQGLIQSLAQCEHPYSCPHGRPVMILVGWSELEKRFARR
jgi:DNA mismatch repair protein MutL